MWPKNPKLFSKFALILLVLISSANASSLFDSSDILHLSLVGPLGSLIEEKDRREEKKFVLHVDGVEERIKVRVRGKSRLRVCDFPPLRLKFDKKSETLSQFQGQNKLKLVTHCDHREASETNVLQEYAIYRIFNKISDVSYRVRLVRVSYTDTDGLLKKTTGEKYGVLIESSSDLAKRTGGEELEVEAVALGSLDLIQAAKVFVFQYMIANTDWSLVSADLGDSCCHNGDLFQIDSKIFYVPYDFDLSGLVNARYAFPAAGLKITRVTDRLYRGYCIPLEPLETALNEIKAQQDTILAEIYRTPGLTEKNAAQTAKFVDKFFDKADDQGKLLRSFERRCL